MEQERLNQAIQYSQSGNKDQARKILLKLIQEDSGNEAAWLWLVDVCDSDDERKAILNRALHLNPSSRMLKQAFGHFNNTGTLDASFLKTPPAEPSKSSPQPSPKIVETEPVIEDIQPQQSESLDLGWLEVENEGFEAGGDEVEENGLATISDEEFSKLSEAFFVQDQTDQMIDPVKPSEPISNGLDILNDFHEQQELPGEFKISEDDDVVEDDDLKAEPILKKSQAPQAIEDELKQAFIDASGQEKKKRKIAAFFSNNSRRLILIFGSLFWLLVLVFAGIFLVNRFNIFGQNEPEEGLSVISEAEQVFPTETPELIVTPTATISFAQTSTVEPEDETAEAVESIPVFTKIDVESISALEYLAQVDGGGWVTFNPSHSVYSALQPEGVIVYEMDGTERVTFTADESDPITAILLSDDGSRLLGFSPSLKIYVWDVDRVGLIRVISIPDEYKDVLSSINFEQSLAKPTLAISTDLRRVALGYWGGVFVWNADDGVLVFSETMSQSEFITFKDEKQLNYSVSFAEDNEVVYYGGGKQVGAYHFLEDSELWKVWSAQILGLKTLPEARLLEWGNKDNPPENTQYVRLRDTESGIIIAEYTWTAGISSISASKTPMAYLASSKMLLIPVDAGSAISLALVDAVSGERRGTIQLDSYHPIYAIQEVSGEDLVAVWYVNPNEVVTDYGQVEFFDLITFESRGICETCQLKPNITPAYRSMFISPEAENLILCAAGYGCSEFGFSNE